MKEIIYNNKTKKMLIALLIFMLLFNFIFPNVVMAADYSKTGTIQEIVTSIVTKSSGAAVGESSNQTIGDVYGNSEKALEKLETEVKKKIEEQFSSLNEEELDKVYRDYRNSIDNIKVSVRVSENYQGVTSITITTTVNLEQSDIDKTLAKSDDEIGYIDTDGGVIIGSGAVGQDPDKDITVKREGDGGDLGGILLAPVFALVNFIADAIIGNVGSIMTGDGPVTGIGILQSSTIPPETGKTYHDFPVDTSWNILGSIQYPNIKYTPEEIFAGEIELLSIDFISGKNSEGEEITGDWSKIRNIVATWYKILRMIAIIGLLSVLIYTGIKIIISANAKDKAKFKEWIINWFMAVAILFFMHYIMAFIISVTGEFSKLISNASQGIKIINGSEESVTNLMGLVRFMIQSENFYMKIGYEVMYIALIVYTIKFTVIYLKRVLNMAFLTLIAPIVALTYPIDKLNDGQAQGFNMWLKEYIFNALLQPMHCILYYILMGAAIGIAAENPIYGIVVLMFMTEAEKLLKKIFGFDKAGGGTVGGMAGAFAAGAIASSVKDIARMSKLPGGNGKKDGSGGGKDNGIDAPKPTDKPGMDEFLNDGDDKGGLLGDGSNGGSDEPKTDQQEMLDAYDDNYGTGEWDAAERDAMAREAYANDGGMEYSEDEYRQILMDSGYEGEDLENAMREGGYGDSTSALGDTQEASTQTDSNQTPIRELANNNSSNNGIKKFKRGAGAVGKRLLKPAWDLDKSKSYNFKRLAKGGLRAVAGVTIGTAAAAVQAGISITDGKYNPMEGVATFAAGYVGGGKLAKGVGSLYDTYKEGTLPTDAKARKEEVMRRAQASFGDRDDVIAFNKKNYPGQEKEMMEREKNNYLTRGVTDLKEMKSGMKYADTLVKNGITQKQADRRAAATIDFKKTLQSQGQSAAVYDKEKQEKYIKMMVDRAQGQDKAKVRKQYENAFKAVAAYDEANR